MVLLTKWNLSEACGSDILKFSRKICRDNVILPTSVKQGHQLMDQMNVPHISFRKAPIMTYMEETHRAPIDFGNNRIELIGNRFSVSKFNRIYRYFSFGK